MISDAPSPEDLADAGRRVLLLESGGRTHAAGPGLTAAEAPPQSRFHRRLPPRAEGRKAASIARAR